MENKCTEKNAIDDLIRRVEATYRIRINAATRLRNTNNHNKKLNIYYSALVTGISIVTIGFKTKYINIDLSNIVLMFSIILSYYSFYISEQNLQERAYRMEETYRELDKLRNKLLIYGDYRKDEINEEFCKKMYKQYEQIISNIENHLDIDFKKYLIYQSEKEKEKKLCENMYIKLQKDIKIYEYKSKIKYCMQYIIPAFVALVILVFH